MLKDSEIQLICDAQSESIQAKKLTSKQLELIYKNNWFNIWVPKVYAGLGYSFPEGLELLEEIAYYDGGLAWTVTLCSGANMFAGFMDPIKAKEIFCLPKVCFGGSGRATGKAIWDGAHYYISGTWAFATGAPHLSHFTLNAPIYDGDVARVDGSGEPVVYSFFVPRDQVMVHYDWNTFGLECTASHSFTVDKVKVDANQAFVLLPEKRMFDSALYRIPFIPFAELTLLMNYLGMYRRFLDLSEKYFFEKSKDKFWADKFSKSRFRKVDQLQQELEKNRLLARDIAVNLWEHSERTSLAIGADYLLEISTLFKDMVETIRRSVVEIMPLLGIQAAQVDNELNIVFRNLFTASQHSLLNVKAD